MKVYGIPNCGSVKKARLLLEEQGAGYEFIDFKKAPPSTEMIQSWVDQAGIEVVLNKRGTTWRKLDDAQKAETDSNKLIALMAEQPSLIKRPVIETGKGLLVGFDADRILNSL
jgi:arsenate reductase